MVDLFDMITSKCIWGKYTDIQDIINSVMQKIVRKTPCDCKVNWHSVEVFETKKRKYIYLSVWKQKLNGGYSYDCRQIFNRVEAPWDSEKTTHIFSVSKKQIKGSP